MLLNMVIDGLFVTFIVNKLYELNKWGNETQKTLGRFGLKNLYFLFQGFVQVLFPHENCFVHMEWPQTLKAFKSDDISWSYICKLQELWV